MPWALHVPRHLGHKSAGLFPSCQQFPTALITTLSMALGMVSFFLAVEGLVDGLSTVRLAFCSEHRRYHWWMAAIGAEARHGTLGTKRPVVSG